METRLQTGVALHLVSGIPVVEMVGECSEAMVGELAGMVDYLARAGHVDIIISFARAAYPTGKGWLKKLEDLAVSLRTHFGHLDIVGAINPFAGRSQGDGRSTLLWSKTEEEAICHIKGIPMATSGLKLKMQLTIH